MSRERAIIFSGPMVRAILEGRKTQTRRVLREQPTVWETRRVCGVDVWKAGKYQYWPPGVTNASMPGEVHPHAWGGREHLARCPYGVPGDRLWVRETLRQNLMHEWTYALDAAPVLADDETAAVVWAHHKDSNACPSIYMPRWASRITLEVVSVWVERLTLISADNIRAEGFPGYPTCDSGAFKKAWDQINGKRAPWASDPWVWVVKFRVSDGR